MLVTFTCAIKVTSIFFQAVGKPTFSAIVSLTRDIICFVPLVIILPQYFNINGILIAAPVADTIGVIVSICLLITFFKKLTNPESMTEKETVINDSHKGAIITIAREHGSQGKYIGELLAKKLKIPYYYKEMTAIAAKESGLDKEFISKINNDKDPLHSLYLSTTPVKYAIEAQDKVIKQIASKGSCVIVGRAADYVLRDNKDVIKIFIYAPKEYRIKKVMEMYKDSKDDAKKNVISSDKARAKYYKIISGLEWGRVDNYDLCINSQIGPEKTADIICQFINK